MIFSSLQLQVTSKEFVEKMLASVTAPLEGGKGSVEVLIDSAEGIHWVEGLDNASVDSGRKKKRTVAGVLTKSHGVVLGSSVVVCLGPWSGQNLLYCLVLRLHIITQCMHCKYKVLLSFEHIPNMQVWW